MSGKTKFTPGPWQVRGAVDTWRCVFAEDGDLAELTIGRSRSEMLANAALIASAPDLYAALDFCRKYASIAGNEFPSQLQNTIDAALAKARGE